MRWGKLRKNPLPLGYGWVRAYLSRENPRLCRNAIKLSRHSGRDCSPRPWGSSFGPCCARPNLLRANLCRTNRQGEAQCGERAGQGRTAQDSRAKRDGVAWRGRFAREAPVGCRTGSVRHESSAQGSDRPLPSMAFGPRRSNRKRCLREHRSHPSLPGRRDGFYPTAVRPLRRVSRRKPPALPVDRYWFKQP